MAGCRVLRGDDLALARFRESRSRCDSRSPSRRPRRRRGCNAQMPARFSASSIPSSRGAQHRRGPAAVRGCGPGGGQPHAAAGDFRNAGQGQPKGGGMIRQALHIFRKDVRTCGSKSRPCCWRPPYSRSRTRAIGSDLALAASAHRRSFSAELPAAVRLVDGHCTRRACGDPHRRPSVLADVTVRVAQPAGGEGAADRPRRRVTADRPGI